MAMRRGRSASPRRPNAKRTGERRFLVSMASSKGGGRTYVRAKTPKSAASKAVNKKFIPKNLSVIVTDLSKKRGNQSFF